MSLVTSKNPILIRRLYRSLLRTAKPFTGPAEHAVALNCFLHRTGMGDAWDQEILYQMKSSGDSQEKTKDQRSIKHVSKSREEARDLTKSYAAEIIEQEMEKEELSRLDQKLNERKAPHRVMFRRLLREVVTGKDGFRQMQYPSEVDTQRLKRVIKREFRSIDSPFDLSTRQQVGFLALRELNKKLNWANELLEKEAKPTAEQRSDRNHGQAARNVFPLPLYPPSDCVKPGTYLIAHPLQTGYFRRTVICIFDHSDTVSTKRGGTYGLIINRIGVSPSSGKRQTLQEVLRTMPPQLIKAFGNCTVREGGPVHVSLQMVHARSPEQAPLGGNVLSPPSSDENATSAALNSDKAIYYQGDMMVAADSVINGDLDREDVSFYVGASCWEPGQLEDEIRRGFWLPCRGPPEMALYGICDRFGDDDKSPSRPRADLWLSLMCSLGQDEANLAHLLFNDNQQSEYDLPCDAF